MAKLTVREAVKRYKVSRPTLMKHLKDGKISGVKEGVGIGKEAWKIDLSELTRVYDPRESATGQVNSQVNHDGHPSFQVEETPEYKQLRRDLEAARERIDDLQADKDAWKEQAQNLARLAPPDRAGGSAGGFWSRLFKRG